MAPLPLTIVKPVPVMDAPVMFTVAVPVLVTLTVWLAVLPTATLPKDTEVELGLRIPAPELPVWPPPPVSATEV